MPRLPRRLMPPRRPATSRRGLGQPHHIARWHEETILAVLDQFRDAADGAGNDGRAAGQRFENDESERLLPDRRHDHCCRVDQFGTQVLMWDKAGKFHPVLQSPLPQAGFQIAAQWPLADDL